MQDCVRMISVQNCLWATAWNPEQTLDANGFSVVITKTGSIYPVIHPQITVRGVNNNVPISSDILTPL